MENDFLKAEIGQKLWFEPMVCHIRRREPLHPIHIPGHCDVYVRSKDLENKIIAIIFPNKITVNVNSNGFLAPDDERQSIYWQKPEIEFIHDPEIEEKIDKKFIVKKIQTYIKYCELKKCQYNNSKLLSTIYTAKEEAYRHVLQMIKIKK